MEFHKALTAKPKKHQRLHKEKKESTASPPLEFGSAKSAKKLKQLKRDNQSAEGGSQAPATGAPKEPGHREADARWHASANRSDPVASRPESALSNKQKKAEKRKRALAEDTQQPAPASQSKEESNGISGKPAGSKAAKRQKLMQNMFMAVGRKAVVTPAQASEHPFEVDAGDHCETPLEAYRDVEPFLFQLATRLKKPKAALQIYDPYFCEGSMVAHLRTLGFENVYNRNEDFYKVVEEGRLPQYDVLVTNPPYSADHFERILRFAAGPQNRGRPWLLLLPRFVARKKYYGAALGPALARVLYLLPQRKYRYWAPGRAGGEADHALGTAPFESMWFLSLDGGSGSGGDAALQWEASTVAWWQKKFARASACTLAPTLDALPPPLLEANEVKVKRLNPKMRKKLAAKHRQ